MSLFPLPWRMVAPYRMSSCFGASEDVFAEYAVAQGCYMSSLDSRSPLTHPMQVSLFGCSAGSSAFLLGFTSAFPNRFCAFTVLQGFSLQASTRALLESLARVCPLTCCLSCCFTSTHSVSTVVFSL